MPQAGGPDFGIGLGVERRFNVRQIGQAHRNMVLAENGTDRVEVGGRPLKALAEPLFLPELEPYAVMRARERAFGRVVFIELGKPLFVIGPG